MPLAYLPGNVLIVTPPAPSSREEGLFPTDDSLEKSDALRSLAALGLVVVEYRGSVEDLRGALFAVLPEERPRGFLPDRLSLAEPGSEEVALWNVRPCSVEAVSFYGNAWEDDLPPYTAEDTCRTCGAHVADPHGPACLQGLMEDAYVGALVS